jgi:hypothetical protein
VERRFAIRTIMRAPMGLAINGNQIAVHLLEGRTHCIKLC